MRFGLPISFLLHLGFFGAGMIILSNAKPMEVETQVIPIEIASISEITNIRAAVKRPVKPKPQPEPEPEQPMTLENPMENSDNKGAEVSVPTEVLPQPAAPQPVPSEEPAAEPQEVIEEPQKPATPEFNLDKFAAVIDRTRDSQPDVGQQRTLQSEENFYVYAQTANQGVGDSTALTMNELDALRQRMYRCWRIPADAPNPAELVVEVRVKMRADGIVQDVSLANPGKVSRSPNSFMPIAARRAVNAVRTCGPYDFLPPEKYSVWQDMTLRFIPEM